MQLQASKLEICIHLEEDACVSVPVLVKSQDIVLEPTPTRAKTALNLVARSTDIVVGSLLVHMLNEEVVHPLLLAPPYPWIAAAAVQLPAVPPVVFHSIIVDGGSLAEGISENTDSQDWSSLERVVLVGTRGRCLSRSLGRLSLTLCLLAQRGSATGYRGELYNTSMSCINRPDMHSAPRPPFVPPTSA